MAVTNAVWPDGMVKHIELTCL